MEHAARVLIYSPQPAFLKAWRAELERSYRLERAYNREMAIFLSSQWNPQIIIVDGTAGVDVVKAVRALKKASCAIIVIGEGSPSSEEKAFHAGADHYIPLPFDFNSLALRMKASLRHFSTIEEPPPPTTAVLTFDHFTLDPVNQVVRHKQEVARVSPIQFKLLFTFLSQPERLFSREELKAAVWEDMDISLRSIDAQISKLKKAFPDLEEKIINVYGRGYMLTRKTKTSAA